MKYTVIGFYAEEGESYVEWVEAKDAPRAVEKAVAMDAARADATVISVLKGHHIEQYPQWSKGA